MMKYLILLAGAGALLGGGCGPRTTPPIAGPPDRALIKINPGPCEPVVCDLDKMGPPERVDAWSIRGKRDLPSAFTFSAPRSIVKGVN